MIYFVDANDNVVSSAEGDNLDNVTSLNGGVYVVLVSDTTAQTIMQSATNSTLQIQELSPTGTTNKFGLPTATGNLVAVPIDSTTLANQQRQAIKDKYAPQIDVARQNYWNAVSDGKPLTTQQKYQDNIKTLISNQNSELLGV